MDINAYTTATLSNGDSVGMQYSLGSTNATDASPTMTANYFLSNPGSFAVSGTVVAAVQTVFNDVPAQLAFSTDRESELYFTYNVMNQTQPVLVPGTNWTCTIYDKNTLIGSSTTVVGGSTSGGVTNSFAQCTGVYPAGAGGTQGAGHAYVTFPATYNSGDVYTYLISH